MPLHYVDPHAVRSPLYRAIVRFGRSRYGQWYAHTVARRIDPWMYRATRGWLMSRPWTVATAPLTTTGARSGRAHEVQLTYFHDGDSPILIASNYGGSRHPHWYHNLIAHPECKFGDDAFVAREITDPTEYDRLYALAEHVYAGYGDYRTATARFDRHIPVFRLEPSHE
ncbi:MAG: nitroreductase/quinone reductase family protein [Rhodococcus sp. (in: high G+C Gram-positive bacteria)]|uniref:nitroreductase/quinone reductase family protein n=1 Tax=Rhodococcus sp. TaxID=1831 RepID=UPI003BB6233F